MWPAPSHDVLDRALTHPSIDTTPGDVELHKEQKMWPLYVTLLSQPHALELRLACSDSSPPRADRSAFETVTRHSNLLGEMEVTIADTAKALIVVSGLKFRAFIGLSWDVWFRFQPPKGATRAALLQQYSLAAEQGLDHFETLQLVCEMGYILNRFLKLSYMLSDERFKMMPAVDADAWLECWSASHSDQSLEIGLASVEKWNCRVAREEDLQLWQAEAADVLDRATEMLRGRMNNIGRETRDSTTLRRRR